MTCTRYGLRLRDDAVARQSERMLERTDTILTMVVSLLGTAEDELAAGWHHDITTRLAHIASTLRVERAAIRTRLDTVLDEGDDD